MSPLDLRTRTPATPLIPLFFSQPRPSRSNYLCLLAWPVLHNTRRRDEKHFQAQPGKTCPSPSLRTLRRGLMRRSRETWEAYRKTSGPQTMAQRATARSSESPSRLPKSKA